MAAGAERVGSQGRGKGFIGFRYGWGLNWRWSRRRLSSPGSPRGRPPRWFSLSSRRCRIKFRLTPLKPNIARIQVLAGCRLQGDLHGHNTDEAHGSANERLVKVGHWHQPITRTPAQYRATVRYLLPNPATVTVSPPEPSATEMPSGSGSLVMPFWFSIARCAGEPNGFIRPRLSSISASGRGKPTAPAQFQLCR